jgi:hypothetical protein
LHVVGEQTPRIGSTYSVTVTLRFDPDRQPRLVVLRYVARADSEHEVSGELDFTCIQPEKRG